MVNLVQVFLGKESMLIKKDLEERSYLIWHVFHI